jgi:hypothetical protein
MQDAFLPLEGFRKPGRDTPSFAADSSRVHPRRVRQFNKRMANSSFLERAPLISLLGAFIAVASTAGQGAFRAVGISEDV